MPRVIYHTALKDICLPYEVETYRGAVTYIAQKVTELIKGELMKQGSNCEKMKTIFVCIAKPTSWMLISSIGRGMSRICLSGLIQKPKNGCFFKNSEEVWKLNEDKKNFQDFNSFFGGICS